MTETGIWSQQEADKYHQSSPKLAAWLKDHLDVNSPVYDFGCGNGYYLHELENDGYLCLGIEGNYLKNKLNQKTLVHDLTKPFDEIEKTHFIIRGSVLCFEVMEHVPAYAEQQLLDTITSVCAVDLILSWAEVGQPGVGHINCVSQEYAIEQIVNRGFNYKPGFTKMARMNIDKNCDWFERTLLVFERK